MLLKDNIERLLFESGISNYKISKDTGIAQTTLSRFSTKKSTVGNMSLDNAIKLNEYYKKRMIEMLTYKGLEYKDEQVNVEFTIKGFEDVIRRYESIKYSDVDFELRPSRETLKEEFAEDLGNELEETLDNEYDEITVGYVNNDSNTSEFMKFDFKIEEETKTDIIVKVKYLESFIEYWNM